MNFRRPLSVVTPTLDGDILALLAAGDAAHTGREIQERIGASQEGVRSALKRLVDEGIVLREIVGRAHHFRMNRQHLAAPWIEGLASLRLQLIDRLRTALAQWETPPVAAVLFGSAARKDAGPRSDLDILVIRSLDTDADAPIWRTQIMTLQAAATAWTGNDARVLEFDETEAAKSPEPVLDAAVREGIELFGSVRRLRAHGRRR